MSVAMMMEDNDTAPTEEELGNLLQDTSTDNESDFHY